MPSGEDQPTSRHIEIDRAGRKWSGSYRVSGREVEVHCAHGTRKAMAHDVPSAAEPAQAHFEGLARLLLVEIIDRHLGLSP